MGAHGWLSNLRVSGSAVAGFIVTTPGAEGLIRMLDVKEVGGSSNTGTIQAKNGVHTVSQTIERLSEITIGSADGGVLLLADGISNWMIVARVGT